MTRLLVGLALLCTAIPDSPAVAADFEYDPRVDAQWAELDSLYRGHHYDEAIALAERRQAEWLEATGADSYEHCSFYGYLGLMLNRVDRLDEADAAYRKGLECTRLTAGPEHADIPWLLNNYSSVLGKRSEFARSELALQEALRLYELNHGAESLPVAVGLNNLGLVQSDVGNNTSALETFRRSVAICRRELGTEHERTAIAQTNLGRTYSRLGRYAEADSLLRTAYQTNVKVLGAESWETALSLRDLARNLRFSGRQEEALAAYVESHDILLEALGEVHTVGVSYVETGEVLWALGRHAEAWERLEKGLAIYARNDDPGAGDHQQVRLTVGEFAFEAGDLELAGHHLTAATEMFENFRQRVAKGLNRATTSESPWAPMAALRLESGDEDGAWNALMRAQGRVLEDTMLDGASYPRASIQAALDGRTALIGWLDIPLGQDHRAWGFVLRKDSLHWVRLDASEAARARVDRFRAATSEPGLLGPLRRLAEGVYSDRFAPLAPYLDGTERIIVASTGALLGCPLAALVAGGDWLSSRYEIATVPSPFLFAWLLEQEDRPAGAAFFVGDPLLSGAEPASARGRSPHDDSAAAALAFALPSDDVVRSAAAGDREAIRRLPPLPGSRAEVERLTRLFPSYTALLGRDASEERLLNLARSGALADFDVLHFATHALVDAEDAFASTLVLSQTAPEADLATLESGERVRDGLLSTAEILAEWKLDARLVTLSACNSALGRKVSGEGYVGFAHTFLRAGARSTLVTLWNVPDLATSEFMAAFYSEWQGGASRVEALRRAQAHLRDYEDGDGRRPYQHPYYWAPFVVIGDPR